VLKLITTPWAVKVFQVIDPAWVVWKSKVQSTIKLVRLLLRTARGRFLKQHSVLELASPT
jgi:hypothetical protein